jgi:hypothetical protein
MSSTPNNNLIRPPHQNSSPLTLTIWQQNVNKSSTCQHDLISSARLAKRGIDLVALQEPSINTFGTTIASRDWIPIYPTTHSAAPHKTRSLLLLRSTLLTENWKQIDFPSGDVTVVQLNGKEGQTVIFNVYNDCDSNATVQQLEAFNLPSRNPTHGNSTYTVTTI